MRLVGRVCGFHGRSFLSGQFPSTHGVLNNASVEWEGSSLPGVLRDAGYQAEWVGRGMHQTPPLKLLDTPVCIEDLMPTILYMADVAVPDGVDGQSLLSLMRGEAELDRPYLHIETSPTYHCITDGKEKFIWLVKDGCEQFFDLVDDPNETRNLINDSDRRERIVYWRSELVQTLKDRPEGFSDRERLIAGRPYPGLMRK
jgi:arylsulfatase